jgi:HK97 gp10 family phage protein
MKQHVEGLKEVEEAFADLGKSVSRRIARKALTAGGEILAREMRARAPKKDMNLVESIDVGTQLTRRQKSLHRKQDPVEVFVGAKDPAAVPQEFGTFKDPPQPFARPAWDATQTQVLDRIADELMVGVDQAVARAAAKAKRIK